MTYGFKKSGILMGMDKTVVKYNKSEFLLKSFWCILQS